MRVSAPGSARSLLPSEGRRRRRRRRGRRARAQARGASQVGNPSWAQWRRGVWLERGLRCPLASSPRPRARCLALGLRRKGGRGSSGKLWRRRRRLTSSPRGDAARPAPIPAWRGARPAAAARGRPGVPAGTTPPPSDSAAPRAAPAAPPAGPSFPASSRRPQRVRRRHPRLQRGPSSSSPNPVAEGSRLAQRRSKAGGGGRRRWGCGSQISWDHSQRRGATLRCREMEGSGGRLRNAAHPGKASRTPRLAYPPHRPGQRADLAAPGPELQKRRPGEGQKDRGVLWSLSLRAAPLAGQPHPLAALCDTYTTSQRR